MSKVLTVQWFNGRRKSYAGLIHGAKENGLGNLSLQYNAVGMYQHMKVLTTPTIVAIQFVLYGISLPTLQVTAQQHFASDATQLFKRAHTYHVLLPNKPQSLFISSFRPFQFQHFSTVSGAFVCMYWGSTRHCE